MIRVIDLCAGRATCTKEGTHSVRVPGVGRFRFCAACVAELRERAAALDLPLDALDIRDERPAS